MTTAQTNLLATATEWAAHELAEEEFRAAVESEKARLRAERTRPTWRACLDWVPFTIKFTWRGR